MWRCDNVGGLGEHITFHRSIPVLIFYFILQIMLSPHQWSDVDNLYVTRRLTTKGSAFGGIVHTAPHFLGQIPQNPYFGGVNNHFQA